MFNQLSRTRYGSTISRGIHSQIEIGPNSIKLKKAKNKQINQNNENYENYEQITPHSQLPLSPLSPVSPTQISLSLLKVLLPALFRHQQGPLQVPQRSLRTRTFSSLNKNTPPSQLTPPLKTPPQTSHLTASTRPTFTLTKSRQSKRRQFSTNSDDKNVAKTSGGQFIQSEENLKNAPKNESNLTKRFQSLSKSLHTASTSIQQLSSTTLSPRKPQQNITSLFKSIILKFGDFFLQKLPPPIKKTFHFALKSARFVFRIWLAFFLISLIYGSFRSALLPSSKDLWSFILGMRADENIMKYYGNLQLSLDEFEVDLGKDPRDGIQMKLDVTPPPPEFLIGEFDDEETVKIKTELTRKWYLDQEELQKKYDDPVLRDKMIQSGFKFPKLGIDFDKVDVGKLLKECLDNANDIPALHLKQNVFRQLVMKECYAIRLDIHDLNLVMLRIEKARKNIEQKLKTRFPAEIQPTQFRQGYHIQKGQIEYPIDVQEKLELLKKSVVQCRQIYEEAQLYKEYKGMEYLRDQDNAEKYESFQNAERLLTQATHGLEAAVKQQALVEVSFEEKFSKKNLDISDRDFLLMQMNDLKIASKGVSKSLLGLSLTTGLIEFSHCNTSDRLPADLLTSFCLGAPILYDTLDKFRGLSTGTLLNWNILCENLEFFDQALDLLEGKLDEKDIPQSERIYQKGSIIIPHKNIYEYDVLEDVTDFPTLTSYLPHIPVIVNTALKAFRQSQEMLKQQSQEDLYRQVRLTEQWKLEKRLRAGYEMINQRSRALPDEDVMEKYQERLEKRKEKMLENKIKLEKEQKKYQKKQELLRQRQQRELDFRLKHAGSGGIDLGPTVLPQVYLDALGDELDEDDDDDDDDDENSFTDSDQDNEEELLRQSAQFKLWIREKKIDSEIARLDKVTPKSFDPSKRMDEIEAIATARVLEDEEVIKNRAKIRRQYALQAKQFDDENEADNKHLSKFRNPARQGVYVLEDKRAKHEKMSRLGQSPENYNGTGKLDPEFSDEYIISDVLYSDDEQFTPETLRPKAPSLKHSSNISNKAFTVHPDDPMYSRPPNDLNLTGDLLPPPTKQQQLSLQKIEQLHKEALYNRDYQSRLDVSVAPYERNMMARMGNSDDSLEPDHSQYDSVTHQILSSVFLDPAEPKVGLPVQSQLHVNIFNDTIIAQYEEDAHLKAIETNTILERFPDPKDRLLLKNMQENLPSSRRLLIELDEQGNPVNSIADIYRELDIKLKNLAYQDESAFTFFPLLCGKFNSLPRVPFRPTEINGEVLNLEGADFLVKNSEEAKRKERDDAIREEKYLKKKEREVSVRERYSRRISELFLDDGGLKNEKDFKNDNENNFVDYWYGDVDRDENGMVIPLLFNEGTNYGKDKENEFIKTRLQEIYKLDKPNQHSNNFITKIWYQIFPSKNSIPSKFVFFDDDNNSVHPDTFLKNPEFLDIPTISDPKTGETLSLADIDPVSARLQQIHAQKAWMAWEAKKSEKDKENDFERTILDLQKVFQNSAKSITKTLLHHSRDQIDKISDLRAPLVNPLVGMGGGDSEFTYLNQSEKKEQTEKERQRINDMRIILRQKFLTSKPLTFMQKLFWSNEQIDEFYDLLDDNKVEKFFTEFLLDLDEIDLNYIPNKSEDELSTVLFNISSDPSAKLTEKSVKLIENQLTGNDNGIFYSFGGGRMQKAGHNPILLFSNVFGILQNETREIRQNERDAKRNLLKKEWEAKRLQQRIEYFGGEEQYRNFLLQNATEFDLNSPNFEQNFDQNFEAAMRKNSSLLSHLQPNSTVNSGSNGNDITTYGSLIESGLDDKINKNVKNTKNDPFLSSTPPEPQFPPDPDLDLPDRIKKLTNMTTEERIAEYQRIMGVSLDEMADEIPFLDSNNPKSPYFRKKTMTEVYIEDKNGIRLDDMDEEEQQDVGVAGKQNAFFRRDRNNRNDEDTKDRFEKNKHDSILVPPQTIAQQRHTSSILSNAISQAQSSTQRGYNPFDLRANTQAAQPLQLKRVLDEFELREKQDGFFEKKNDNKKVAFGKNKNNIGENTLSNDNIFSQIVPDDIHNQIVSDLSQITLDNTSFGENISASLSKGSKSSTKNWTPGPEEYSDDGLFDIDRYRQVMQNQGEYYRTHKNNGSDKSERAELGYQDIFASGGQTTTKIGQFSDILQDRSVFSDGVGARKDISDRIVKSDINNPNFHKNNNQGNFFNKNANKNNPADIFPFNSPSRMPVELNTSPDQVLSPEQSPQIYQRAQQRQERRQQAQRNMLAE
jgi:hypothetical protein